MWVLLSAGVMLAPAAALPEVFIGNRSAAIFGVIYTTERLIGLGLCWTGLADDRSGAPLRTYLPVQLVNWLLLLVVGPGCSRARASAGGRDRIGPWGNGPSVPHWRGR